MGRDYRIARAPQANPSRPPAGRTASSGRAGASDQPTGGAGAAPVSTPAVSTAATGSSGRLSRAAQRK